MTKVKIKAFHKKERKMCRVISIDFRAELIVVRFPEYEEMEAADSKYDDTMDLDEFEIVPYTGVTDNKGRDIYEYDAVRVRTKFGMAQGLVLFKDGAYMVYWDSRDKFPKHGEIKNYYYLGAKNTVSGNFLEDNTLLGEQYIEYLEELKGRGWNK